VDDDVARKRRAATKRYDRYDRYLSVPADGWIVAMEAHAAALLGHPRVSPPSPVDNGHACALSLMAVLLLDSLANRAAYMVRELGALAALAGTTPLDKHPRNTMEFLLALIEEHTPDAPKPDTVREVYVLRNVLAHGYLWLVDFAETADSPSIDVLSAVLADGFGNVTFEAVVDGWVSRRLRLNLVPTLVDRRDAGTVLEVSWQAIHFLSGIRGAAVSAGALRAMAVNRRLMSLEDVATALLA
jgi:hypothetical protein